MTLPCFCRPLHHCCTHSFNELPKNCQCRVLGIGSLDVWFSTDVSFQFSTGTPWVNCSLWNFQMTESIISCIIFLFWTISQGMSHMINSYLYCQCGALFSLTRQVGNLQIDFQNVKNWQYYVTDSLTLRLFYSTLYAPVRCVHRSQSCSRHCYKSLPRWQRRSKSWDTSHCFVRKRRTFHFQRPTLRKPVSWII